MDNFQDHVLRLKAIFDAAVDGIIIINNRGKIEEVNEAACKLFQYEPGEMIGQNVSILMPMEHRINHDGYIKNYHQTGVAKIIGIGREVNGRRKTGEEFPFWLAVIEVKLHDRIIYTGFVHDLSEIKQAEKRLKLLNEELEKKVVERTYELENVVNQLLALNQQLEDEIANKIKAQEQLKEREAALEESLVKERELGELKSRFVSMASHEFRTPLSTILSSVSLIGKYTTTEQQVNRDKHINKVKSSVSHLTNILNDFLSMNKLEEGKIQAGSEDISIEELFNDVTEELKTLLKGNQQLNTTSICSQKNIRSDGKILKNILINLISNAIKYTDEQGVIECRLTTSNQELMIAVKDNGIGIPEEDQKHLFDRFFRASNATNIEGTGLGLNIVKKYIEMLHGEIKFNSRVYEGTEFIVRLPITL
jgi:two-component system sensor kinase FixL